MKKLFTKKSLHITTFILLAIFIQSCSNPCGAGLYDPVRGTCFSKSAPIKFLLFIIAFAVIVFVWEAIKDKLDK